MCIRGIENNISQMVIIEENENFHPRRKVTSLKMMAFLEKIFCLKKPYIKVTKVLKILAAVVKKLLQFESGCGPKSPLPGIGLRGAPL